jgi:Arc/MetJ-type ribon-helix-helix transcriptional regulator
MLSEKGTIGTRVSRPMADEINQLVEAGKYLNMADFLRDAAREKLAKEKEEN